MVQMDSHCKNTICNEMDDAKVSYIIWIVICIICNMDEENNVMCENSFFTSCISQKPLIYADCFRLSYDIFTCLFKTTTNTLPTIKTVSISYNLTSTSTKFTNSNSTFNSDYLFSRKGTLVGGIVGGVLAFVLIIILIFIIFLCIRHEKKKSMLKQNSENAVNSGINNKPAAISNSNKFFYSGNESDNNQIAVGPQQHYTPVETKSNNKMTQIINEERIYENQNIKKISARKNEKKTNDKMFAQKEIISTKLTNNFEMNDYYNHISLNDNDVINKQIENSNAIEYHLSNHSDDTVILENNLYPIAK